MIKKFAEKIRELIDIPSDKAILDWITFADEVARNNDTDIHNELTDILMALQFVKNNFNKDVFQDCIRFQTLANEIVNAAFCFNCGLGKNDIQHFANYGFIECGYLPKSAEEKGVFSLAIAKEPINQTILFANTETGAIIEILSAAMNDMSKDGNYYTKLVEKKCNNPQEVFIYECPELNEAFKTALGNTNAFKELVIYEPTENKLQVMGLSGSAGQENGIKMDGFI